ncbi:hypothetical protein D3C87_1048050 [compost metagenome]
MQGDAAVQFITELDQACRRARALLERQVGARGQALADGDDRAFQPLCLRQAHFVKAQRIGQLALQTAAGAAEEGAGRRRQEGHFIAGRRFRTVTEDQPGQLVAVRHARRGHQLGRRRLRRTAHFHARFHVRFRQGFAFGTLAHGQDIERRVIVGAREGDQAPFDRQLLPVGCVLAAGDLDAARHARCGAVDDSGAHIAGQIRVDAHAAQVEGIAQVELEVDIQGQRRRFLAALDFLAQHHHVAALRRRVLRRQFDQRAVGPELALEAEAFVVAHQGAVARQDQGTVGPRQRLQAVGQQFQFQACLAIRKAYPAIGLHLAIAAVKTQALQLQLIAGQLGLQHAIAQFQALVGPVDQQLAAVDVAIQLRCADGAAAGQCHLQGAAQFQARLARQRRQPRQRIDIGGARQGEGAVVADAPAQHLHGGIDVALARARAIEFHGQAQLLVGHVDSRIEGAQAQRQRLFHAHRHVAFFAVDVEHASQRGIFLLGRRHLHVERPLRAQGQVAACIGLQRGNHLRQVGQRHAGRLAGTGPAGAVLDEALHGDAACRQLDDSVAHADLLGLAQARHAAVGRACHFHGHGRLQHERIAALVLQAVDGARPAGAALAAAHLHGGVEIVIARRQAHRMAAARARRAQAGAGQFEGGRAVARDLQAADHGVERALAGAHAGAAFHGFQLLVAKEGQVLAIQGQLGCGRIHLARDGAGRMQHAGKARAQGRQLRRIEFPRQLVRGAPQRALGQQAVRSQAQFRIDAVDAFCIGRQLGVAGQRRVLQGRFAQGQVEGHLPVARQAAVAVEIRIDIAVRQRCAKRGRVDLLQGTRHFQFRLLLRSRQAHFAAGVDGAVGCRALAAGQAQALRIGNKARARLLHRALHHAAGQHRAQQVALQGGQLARIDVPVQLFTGAAKVALGRHVVLAQRQLHVDAAEMGRVGRQLALAGQGLVEQLAGAHGEVRIRQPCWCHVAIRAHVEVQVGYGEGAEVGGIETAGAGHGLERLLVLQADLARRIDAAFARLQGRLAQLHERVGQGRFHVQAQLGFTEFGTQGLRLAVAVEHDVADDLRAVDAAVNVLQVDLVRVQGQLRIADGRVGRVAVKLAATREFARVAEIDDGRFERRGRQGAAQARLELAQRQLLLVDGARRGVVEDGKLARHGLRVGARVDGGIEFQAQVRLWQGGVKLARIDVAAFDAGRAQDDDGIERRQRQPGVGRGRARVALGRDVQHVQVAAQLQGERGRFFAGGGVELRQACLA